MHDLSSMEMMPCKHSQAPAKPQPMRSVISAEDEKEYFFHRGALDAALDFDRLRGGEKVDFVIEQSPKGLRANTVRPA